jgi:predicted  nucleic acid-binding Zn-ribbon protein
VNAYEEQAKLDKQYINELEIKIEDLYDDLAQKATFIRELEDGSLKLVDEIKALEDHIAELNEEIEGYRQNALERSLYR